VTGGLLMANPEGARYQTGDYEFDFGDDVWKAREMRKVIARIPDAQTIVSYADIGCGNGGVFVSLYNELLRCGFPLRRAIGYDIASAWHGVAAKHPEVEFRTADFLKDDIELDLATLNDVIEHVTCPQTLLAGVARRCRYVALHIPLDDRLSVLLSEQWNRRIGPVGHISFWNPASALNIVTSSGLLPLYCRFTPGFLAPSGRKRLLQQLALPIRMLAYAVSPGVAAATVGGVSLAILCRGGKE
jgi:SAM-dependent methyltransferase